MDGMFLENGPLRVNGDGKVTLNGNGWFQTSNLLFGKKKLGRRGVRVGRCIYAVFQFLGDNFWPLWRGCRGGRHVGRGTLVSNRT